MVGHLVQYHAAFLGAPRIHAELLKLGNGRVQSTRLN